MKLHLRSSLLSLIHVKMCKEKGWVDWFRVGGVIAAAFFFLKTNQKKKTTVKIFDSYTEESEYIQAAKRIGEEVDPCPLNEVRLALLIRSPSPHNLCDPLFISHSPVWQEAVPYFRDICVAEVKHVTVASSPPTFEGTSSKHWKEMTLCWWRTGTGPIINAPSCAFFGSEGTCVHRSTETIFASFFK